MSPWINYHHLFYFKTIAEEGSVSKAAEKLRVGQPTLSAQLKSFEDTIGVPLFERQHKKLILTEQGRVALDYAKSIFKMGSEMYEVLHDRLKPNKPFLQLGAIDSVSKQIVLELVKQAFEISPCQVTLSEGKFDELFRQLSAHHIDLVVTNFLPVGVAAKGLYPKSITKKPVSFYGSPKFKNLKKNFPYSISGQSLILPTYDSKLRQDLENWAKLHKIELNIITESQDISMQQLMAVNEMGLIPMAAHSVSKQMQESLMQIGQLQGVYEEIFLVKTQRKIENPISSKIWESFNV